MGQGFISKYILRGIADFIRGRKNTTAEIKPVDMVAELESIPTYEQGKQAEYDRFWDMFQQNGNRRVYQHAFSHCWNDSCYNPKYPIICSSANVYTATNVFSNSDITDTKVPITITGTRADAVFMDCSHLKIIRSLTIENIIRFNNTFRNNSSLEELNLYGTLDIDGFNVQWSPLNPASMKTIIACLVNFAGTDKQDTCTIKFNENCWAALEADSTAPDGGTWKGYVWSLGWLT